MLKEAQSFLRLAPSYAIFPGAAIALAVLGCNLLGDGFARYARPQAIAPTIMGCSKDARRPGFQDMGRRTRDHVRQPP